MKWRQPLECGRSGYCWQTRKMSDKLQFVGAFGSRRVMEASDKLKFVGHFHHPFTLLPSLPAVSLGTALVVHIDTLATMERKPIASLAPEVCRMGSGLPKRSRAPALQRLRRSDLCTRFRYLLCSWSFW